MMRNSASLKAILLTLLSFTYNVTGQLELGDIYTEFCPKLSQVPHGRYNLSNVERKEIWPGTAAEFSCDENSFMVGLPTLTCLEGGIWDSDPPFCVQTCEDTFDEEGLIVPPPYLNSHTYNFTCLANAAENRSTNKTTRYKCLSNGTWDKPFEPCSIKCGGDWSEWKEESDGFVACTKNVRPLERRRSNPDGCLNSTVEIKIEVPLGPNCPDPSYKQPRCKKANSYIGCYMSRNTRICDESVATEGMTIEVCIRHCSKLGYRLAGLHAGADCGCANFIYHSQIAPIDKNAAECYIPCSGNDLQICGGEWAKSFYCTKSDFMTTTTVATTTTTTVASFEFEEEEDESFYETTANAPNTQSSTLETAELPTFVSASTINTVKTTTGLTYNFTSLGPLVNVSSTAPDHTGELNYHSSNTDNTATENVTGETTIVGSLVPIDNEQFPSHSETVGIGTSEGVSKSTGATTETYTARTNNTSATGGSTFVETIANLPSASTYSHAGETNSNLPKPDDAATDSVTGETPTVGSLEPTNNEEFSSHSNASTDRIEFLSQKTSSGETVGIGVSKSTGATAEAHTASETSYTGTTEQMIRLTIQSLLHRGARPASSEEEIETVADQSAIEDTSTFLEFNTNLHTNASPTWLSTNEERKETPAGVETSTTDSLGSETDNFQSYLTDDNNVVTTETNGQFNITSTTSSNTGMTDISVDATDSSYPAADMTESISRLTESSSAKTTGATTEAHTASESSYPYTGDTQSHETRPSNKETSTVNSAVDATDYSNTAEENNPSESNIEIVAELSSTDSATSINSFHYDSHLSANGSSMWPSYNEGTEETRSKTTMGVDTPTASLIGEDTTGLNEMDGNTFTTTAMSFDTETSTIATVVGSFQYTIVAISEETNGEKNVYCSLRCGSNEKCLRKEEGLKCVCKKGFARNGLHCTRTECVCG